MIKDGWIASKQEGYIPTPLSDPFTKEKLIYYILQMGSIVNYLHTKGLGAFASLQIENLMIDPINQKIKFSSPFIQYLKPENDVRGSYMG